MFVDYSQTKHQNEEDKCDFEFDVTVGASSLHGTNIQWNLLEAVSYVNISYVK